MTHWFRGPSLGPSLPLPPHHLRGRENECSVLQLRRQHGSDVCPAPARISCSMAQRCGRAECVVVGRHHLQQAPYERRRRRRQRQVPKPQPRLPGQHPHPWPASPRPPRPCSMIRVLLCCAAAGKTMGLGKEPALILATLLVVMRRWPVRRGRSATRNAARIPRRGSQQGSSHRLQNQESAG
jgi:hypothetical protein